MKFDEMISQLLTLNDDRGIPDSVLPHYSKLLGQLQKKDSTKCRLLEDILMLYHQTRLVPFEPENLVSYTKAITHVFNTYMDFLFIPGNNPFSATSDFAPSILSEMISIVFWEIVNTRHFGLEVSAQKDLPLLCVFSISSGGSIRFKKKRVDVAVVKPCSLELNGISTELTIPLVVAECKTNLDKNMISGIEHSVSDLKKTFPECKYFVVAELSDFDFKKTNYASSGIDEMYILRKQKRNDIKNRKLPRKSINPELIHGIATELIATITAANLKPVDLVTRMQSGKLIGRI